MEPLGARRASSRAPADAEKAESSRGDFGPKEPANALPKIANSTTLPSTMAAAGR
jgi:hypothetical protein